MVRKRKRECSPGGASSVVVRQSDNQTGAQPKVIEGLATRCPLTCHHTVWPEPRELLQTWKANKLFSKITCILLIIVHTHACGCTYAYRHAHALSHTRICIHTHHPGCPFARHNTVRVEPRELLDEWQKNEYLSRSPKWF